MKDKAPVHEGEQVTEEESQAAVETLHQFHILGRRRKGRYRKGAGNPECRPGTRKRKKA